MNSHPLHVLLIAVDEDCARQTRALLNGADTYEVVSAADFATDGKTFDAVCIASTDRDGGLDGLRLAQTFAPEAATVVVCASGDEAVALELAQTGAQECLSLARLDPHALDIALRMAVERAKYRTALHGSEQRRAQAEILRRNAELAALSQISHSLSRLADPDAILEMVFEVVGHVLNNRNLYVALYDEPGQSIYFPIYTINGVRREPASRPLGKHLSEHVIYSKAPLLIEHDMDAEMRKIGIAPIGEPAQCFLAAPMLAGDKVIGVIAVQDYEHPGVYDSGHAELLATVASQAAIALENARLFEAVQRLAVTDDLTGIANRRRLFEQGELELSRAARFGHPLAALMLDIDRFKRLNDRHGHAFGDQALRMVADLCRSHARKIDIVARYGGEEFALLLVETDLNGAIQLAERLRGSIAEAFIPAGARDIQLTVSVGVTVYEAERDNLPVLLDRADRALYAAKQAGRNRVMAG